LVETYGVALDLVLDTFEREGLVPDWESFHRHSIKKQWNENSTAIKIETAILDVYGKEYLEEWRKRWRKVFND